MDCGKDCELPIGKISAFLDQRFAIVINDESMDVPDVVIILLFVPSRRATRPEYLVSATMCAPIATATPSNCVLKAKRALLNCIALLVELKKQ